MTSKEAEHFLDVSRVIRGILLTAQEENDCPVIIACSLIAEHEGINGKEVAKSVDGEELRVALVILADRFVTFAKHIHKNEDFDSIIKLELERCASWEN